MIPSLGERLDSVPPPPGDPEGDRWRLLQAESDVLRADIARAVHYAQLAAKRAADVFAYAEAAPHLQRALTAQARMEPEDAAKRCDLLLGARPLSCCCDPERARRAPSTIRRKKFGRLGFVLRTGSSAELRALGDVLMPAGETERVIEHVAPDALALADGLADHQRAFRACRLAFDSIEVQNMTVGTSQPAYLTWVERAAAYAAPDSVERVHVDLRSCAAGDIQGETQVIMLVMSLQAAIALEHRAAAQALSSRLATLAHLSMAIGDWGYTCIARHLGEAAALTGDPAAARAYYTQALAAASKIGHRPELALIHLRLAELLLDSLVDADRSDALEHLDAAVPELREMHMQPWLERALAAQHKTRVAAASGSAAHK